MDTFTARFEAAPRRASRLAPVPVTAPALLLLVLASTGCTAGEPAVRAQQANSDATIGVQRIPPRFEDYPVGKVAGIRPAPVDLASHPQARQFRTMLSRGAAEGPNFAGHYTVVSWGCETMCQQMMIVDARTGRVVADMIAPLGFEYRLDSRLLIVNPPEAVWESPCPTCQTTYHFWVEGEQRLLAISSGA